MRTLMFALIAALVFPAAIGMVAPQKARAQGPAEAGGKEGAPAKEELPPDSPGKVVLTSPLAMDVVVTQKYPALIHSQRHIEIRSPLTGYLEAIPVREGQAVKKGDVLFNVSTTLYKAKLGAELADVQLVQLELANAKRLIATKAVSADEVRLSEAKLAKAKAKANLAQAELDLTTIRAPFDGLLGRLETQEGSLINQNDSLTTLSDNSMMWVFFNVSERDYLDFMTDRDPHKDLPIELMLAGDRKFPQTGKIGAIEADFDNETGNIPFRADFPNSVISVSDGKSIRLLRHGQSGNVLVRRTVKNAIVIPRQCSFEIVDRHFVFVVGDDGVARQREIAVEHEVDGILVIRKGLEVSDRIVLEGHYRLRDGVKAEYEFRKPEDAIAGLKKGPQK